VIKTLRNHLLFAFFIFKFFIKRHTSSHVLSDDKVSEMSFQGQMWGAMYPVRGKKVATFFWRNVGAKWLSRSYLVVEFIPL